MDSGNANAGLHDREGATPYAHSEYTNLLDRQSVRVCVGFRSTSARLEETLRRLRCKHFVGRFSNRQIYLCRWGQSAGAMSAGIHMVANDGDTEDLFRAAFMQSGAILPLDFADGERGQLSMSHYVDNQQGTNNILQTMTTSLRTPDVRKLKILYGAFGKCHMMT
jgi:hypothetical protein